MSGFPDHLFTNSDGPADLRQGEWKSDSGFLQILRQSWIRHYADYMGEQKACAYIDQLQAQGRLYAHHEPLTIHARVEGRIVGVSSLRPLQGIDLITMLEVHPEYRSMGIGSQLVNALCSASERLMAHVSIHQPRVIAFYRRSGFHVLSRTRVRHGEYDLDFDVVARSTVSAVE